VFPADAQRSAGGIGFASDAAAAAPAPAAAAAMVHDVVEDALYAHDV
jgi:hypothetical protein